MREVGLAVQDLINSGVSVGRDFLWIYENERQKIAERAKLGKPFAVPSTASRRIARFHLVDGVRGTPNMWGKSELRTLQLTATPTTTGKLTLSGNFSLKTRNGKRGYSGKIDGNLTLDPKSGDWTQLRFLADGTAFGAGTYTPNQPKKPYRLLVGILNTDLPESRVVPPEEVATYNRVTRYKNP